MARAACTLSVGLLVLLVALQLPSGGLSLSQCFFTPCPFCARLELNSSFITSSANGVYLMTSAVRENHPVYDHIAGGFRIVYNTALVAWTVVQLPTEVNMFAWITSFDNSPEDIRDNQWHARTTGADTAFQLRCVACAPGKSSNSTSTTTTTTSSSSTTLFYDYDRNMCIPVSSACVAGQAQTAAPTATSDRKCITCCPSGSFNTTAACSANSTNNSCRPCPEGCAACAASASAPSSPTCSRCAAPYFLSFSSSTCVLACPAGQLAVALPNRVCHPCRISEFVTNTNAVSPVCASCHASCASCDGPLQSDCLTCPAGFYLAQGTCSSQPLSVRLQLFATGNTVSLDQLQQLLTYEFGQPAQVSLQEGTVFRPSTTINMSVCQNSNCLTTGTLLKNLGRAAVYDRLTTQLGFTFSSTTFRSSATPFEEKDGLSAWMTIATLVVIVVSIVFYRLMGFVGGLCERKQRSKHAAAESPRVTVSRVGRQSERVVLQSPQRDLETERLLASETLSKEEVVRWWSRSEYIRGVGLTRSGAVQPWFLGFVSGEYSRSLLRSTRPNSFHVRLQDSRAGYFLSVRGQRKIHNIPVTVTQNLYSIQAMPNSPIFPSLHALVRHHRKHPIQIPGKSPVFLRYDAADRGFSYRELIRLVQQIARHTLNHRPLPALPVPVQVEAGVRHFHPHEPLYESVTAGVQTLGEPEAMPEYELQSPQPIPPLPGVHQVNPLYEPLRAREGEGEGEEDDEDDDLDAEKARVNSLQRLSELTGVRETDVDGFNLAHADLSSDDDDNDNNNNSSSINFNRLAADAEDEGVHVSSNENSPPRGSRRLNDSQESEGVAVSPPRQSANMSSDWPFSSTTGRARFGLRVTSVEEVEERASDSNNNTGSSMRADLEWDNDLIGGGGAGGSSCAVVGESGRGRADSSSSDGSSSSESEDRGGEGTAIVVAV
eukprot:m.168969 g.168969  ORF g.168969 m.168969 type:complete len:942 (+) comp17229_c1_seq3:373-3198(+)